MIPFAELSAALDAFASHSTEPVAPVAAPVAAEAHAVEHTDEHEPPPVVGMYDADKSNEIDIGDVLDDDTHHS